jgi:serine/threonine-protein kinase
MNHQRTVFRRISDSERVQLAWEGLTPDLLRRARARIRKLAWLLLAVVGLGGIIDCVYYFKVLGRLDPLCLLATAGGILMSGGLVLASRNGRVAHITVLRLGLAYEVAICLILAVLTPKMSYDDTGSLPYVTWVELLIILFPLIIPSPPRMTLTTAVAAAATRPLGIFLLSLEGIPVPLKIYFVSIMSAAFAAALAYAGSRIVHGMNVDLAQAQRMGSYELESRLGTGGMGEVWRAQHQLLARPAAIKLVRRETLGRSSQHQQMTLARFEREAQATASMHSPHTIQLYDFGIARNGTFYYVMELLQGLDLEALVSRFGPLLPSRVVYLLLQACDSLGEAHEHELIHRDVKPANMYVCRYGRHFDFLKVLDFGLVKTGEGDGSGSKLTGENTVSGTPAFMAPEQIRGLPVDGRTDIYALGCVMHWLLTGSCPFVGRNSMETLVMHLEATPPAPSACTEQPVPPELDRVVLACLEKDPASRPPDTDRLMKMLSTCEVGAPWTEARAREWWGLHLPDSQG